MEMTETVLSPSCFCAGKGTGGTGGTTVRSPYQLPEATERRRPRPIAATDPHPQGDEHTRRRQQRQRFP